MQSSAKQVAGPPHILVVEDEIKIAQVLIEYLHGSDFRATHLDRGDDVLSWVEDHQPDLVLLDLMLPGMSGLDVCTELRRSNNVPIIMLTARVEEVDKLLGLQLGADDYITKPFNPREVIARVQAILRRVHMLRVEAQNAPTNGYRGLIIEAEKFQALVQGQPLDLTPVEFRMLAMLVEQPGRVFSRDQLMSVIYADGRVVSDRTVDSHVKNLRKKLKSSFESEEVIHSIYGVGYKFE